MPTYEFVCHRCGTVFEEVLSLVEYERRRKDEKGLVCTSCGSTDVAPQIAHFEVHTVRKSA